MQAIVGEAYERNPEEPPKWLPVIERLDTVETQRIEWLWHHWLARGQFHLLAGPPSIGKTSLALTLAAKLSRGDWPFQRLGKSLLVCLEDSWTFALAQRMKVAGALLQNVEVVRYSETVEGEERRFRLEDDLRTLTSDLKGRTDLSLIILDPVLRAAGGQTDTHNANQVRSALDPVEELARTTNAAVVGITHLRKSRAISGPVHAGLLDSIMGSSAWAQVARVILLCWKLEETHPGAEEYERALGKVKNNLGEVDGVLPYDVESWDEDNDVSVLRFAKTVQRANATGVIEGGGPTKSEQAETWLKNHVAPGAEALASDLTARAAHSGITQRTLQRARKALEWDTSKTAEGWIWIRPKEAADDDLPPLPPEVPF